MALEPLFNDIAAAIHEKDGKTDGIAAVDFPTRIRAIQTTPTTAPPKDINFFDYDGTLFYSYTLSEAQALSALPQPPIHNGLAFQGWNWSLEKIKALTRPMNVGAMYITDDGKTRLKIHVWDKPRSNVPLYINQTVSNGVTIDWGDGSSVETLDGTGNVNTSHQYAAAGDYTIALGVLDGCELGFGNGTSAYCVMGNIENIGRAYCNLLQEVRIGRGITSISLNSFRSCYSLARITIPNGVTSIETDAFHDCFSLGHIIIPNGVTNVDSNAFLACVSLESIAIPDSIIHLRPYSFHSCYSLARITIPNGVISIKESTFRSCYSLARITIPNGVTSIGTNAFFDCYSLTSVSIPESVTSIGNYAFYNCKSIGEYHIKPMIPPKLSATGLFGDVPPDCIIYVPIGSLEAYKTAEYWSAYADYMREEEDTNVN